MHSVGAPLEATHRFVENRAEELESLSRGNVFQPFAAFRIADSERDGKSSKVRVISTQGKERVAR